MSNFFRWLRWRSERAAFIASVSRGWQSTRSELVVAEQWRRDAIKQLPAVPPYSRLAEHYHSFSQSFCPHYEDLLRGLQCRFRFEIRDVLDVACGAGTLTTRLAKQFGSVFAFDISADMLAQARRACAQQSNAKFALADFRQFDFVERFDAATCACDSLNYIERPDELLAVLARVRRHLRPGGFFVFDVLDSAAMKVSAAYDLQQREERDRFAMCTEYDDWSRKETTYVAFADMAEAHRRIPIEIDDVYDASKNTGFVVLDRLSDSHGFGNYYVLRTVESC